MTAVGWMALVIAGAVAGWLAGFALRLREAGRCVATALVPFAIVAVVTFRFFTADDPAVLTDEQARWRVVFAFVSLVASSFAVLPALPVWLLMESRLGARGR